MSAKDKPVSQPANDKYRDNYDAIFKASRDERTVELENQIELLIQENQRLKHEVIHLDYLLRAK